MHRKHFIKFAAMLPAVGYVMKVNALKSWIDEPESSSLMPVLFLGHGSPMNAIEDNQFVQGFKKIGDSLQTPKAILCISAHWETRGTFVTAMEHPRTIHDFGGFPKALFDVQYPAPGSPQLASDVKETIKSTAVEMDHQWGLDHGAWSVIKHLYPNANIPVVQMSIDYTKPASYHYALAKELAALRRRGVLIIGSGNNVHNLRMVSWENLDKPEFGFDWAIEANEKMKTFIREGNYQALIDFDKQGRAFQLSIPTPEHYLPMIYSLALQEKNEEAFIFNDKPIGGSLAMTSVKIG